MYVCALVVYLRLTDIELAVEQVYFIVVTLSKIDCSFPAVVTPDIFWHLAARVSFCLFDFYCYSWAR